MMVSGLSGYTHEDTWILYDVGIGAVINGVTILGEFTVFSKLTKYRQSPYRKQFPHRMQFT